jgi:hypothetical protein
MPTKCSICARTTDLPAISDLIDAQVPLKEVAAQFHCSYPSLVRHAARHRGPVAPAAGSAGPDAAADDLRSRSDLLWSRSNEVWNSAMADADLRSQISSIQTGLRSLELQAKQAERQAEAKAEADSGGNKVSIGDLDDLVQAMTNPELLPDPVDREKLQIVVRKSQELMRPDCHAVFYKMWECPEFAEALIDYVRDWKPEKKNEPVLEKVSAAN